jgi:hypothetical protein
MGSGSVGGGHDFELWADLPLAGELLASTCSEAHVRMAHPAHSPEHPSGVGSRQKGMVGRQG